MKPDSSLSSLVRYLKYVGLPLTLTVTLYVLFQSAKRRRRAALQNQVVVITGASSGIGEALAHAFYNHGARVVLAARRENELNRVKQEMLAKKLQISTHEPIVLKLDISDLESLELFVQKVYELCGTIDILINNAGVSFRGSILNTKNDVHKQIMFTNYLGPVYLTKAVLPKMVEKKKGHIVFVSSVQGLFAIPDRSAYAATKHAMQAFSDCLRAEMKQHNVDVSILSPGYVKTAVSLNALTGSGDTHGIMDKETAAGFTPEYIADRTIDMVVNKQAELTVSQFTPRLVIFLRHFTPSLYHFIMARRARKTTQNA